MTWPADEIGEEMVVSGRACRLVTHGRRSGRPRSVVVGFVAADDASILVAAGSAGTAWALNLQADPDCLVSVGGRTFRGTAEPLGPAEHALAVRELILRYGTPSEGLGHGLSFRIRPREDGPGTPDAPPGRRPCR